MAIQPVGYLKLYRELFDKPIWVCSTSKQKVILITLLCMANFKEKEWEFEGRKYKCKAGEFITSLESIKKECGEDVSIQNVRTFLKKLETYEFLTNKSTNKSRLISITNWELYQSDEKNQQANQQAANKQLTTKEEGKERKEIYTDDFELFYSQYPNSTNKKQTFTNWQKVIKKCSKEDLLLASENYKKETLGKDKQYIKLSSNFVGNTNFYMDYLPENYKPDNSKANERTKMIEKALGMR